MKRTILWGGLACVAVLVLIQLIPLNLTNPPVTREVKWDAPQTRTLAQRACLDCHSNETTWPWYSRIAPVSFYLLNHIDEGRRRLNFSAWDHPNSDYQEVRRTVETGRMPLWDYVLVHPTARLTSAETQQLLTGLQTTFQNDPPIARERRFSD